LSLQCGSRALELFGWMKKIGFCCRTHRILISSDDRPRATKKNPNNLREITNTTTEVFNKKVAFSCSSCDILHDENANFNKLRNL
jgi:hypothetical protein